MAKGEMILSTSRGYRIKSMKRVQKTLKSSGLKTYIRKNKSGGFSFWKRR